MARSQVLYAKVARRINGDKRVRALKRDTRLAWRTLLTSDHQNGLPGFWTASEAMILDELVDYSPEEWREARAELETAGMLRIDDTERLVWLVKALKSEYNAPDNPNIARSWARKLAQFERCPLFVEYLGALLAETMNWPAPRRAEFLETLQAVGIDPEALPAPPLVAGQQQALALPAPKRPEAPKAPKAKLPFRAQEALEIIAAAAPGRFLATNPGKGAIEIEKVIKEHPDRAEWEELGRYLAAGGESYATELDSRWVTRRNFDAALARARARGAANSDGYQDE
jgi:hypothetical protein